jgi:hypothetical protein
VPVVAAWDAERATVRIDYPVDVRVLRQALWTKCRMRPHTYGAKSHQNQYFGTIDRFRVSRYPLCMSLLFESQTCSRCGGSGHYSYCHIYGTTCFKCHGKKEVLTKRGRVAQGFYTELSSKRIDQLVAGDQFQDITITNGGSLARAWFTVKAVIPDTSRCSSLVNGVEVPGRTDLLAIDAEGCLFAGRVPEERIRVFYRAEQRKQIADLALAYQSILSKSGKEPAWLKTIAY